MAANSPPKHIGTLPGDAQLREMLSGNDRRSIGRVPEVLTLVASHPERVASLVQCLWDTATPVRMRAADVLEKLSRDQAALLQSYKPLLLTLLEEATQQELRWHLAAIVPRLHLTPAECTRAAAVLRGYLYDRSSIVKTFALQGLADLCVQHPTLRPQVIDLVRLATKSGTPAMRARGRKLLPILEAQDP